MFSLRVSLSDLVSLFGVVAVILADFVEGLLELLLVLLLLILLEFILELSFFVEISLEWLSFFIKFFLSLSLVKVIIGTKFVSLQVILFYLFSSILPIFFFKFLLFGPFLTDADIDVMVGVESVHLSFNHPK